MTIKNIFNRLIVKLLYRGWPNVYLGRHFFGNDSGFIANVVGRYVHRKDQKRASFSFKSELEAAYHFKTQGWTRIEAAVNLDDVESLKKRFDTACSERGSTESYRMEWTSIGDSEKFFTQFPEAIKLLTPEVDNYINSYYGAYYRVLNTHIYRIFSVPTEKRDGKFHAYGATECWHNDGSTVESIKLFILLEDVDETKGPMHVISAPETQSIIKKGFSQFKEGLPRSEMEKSANITKFTGKAGDVLLANPNICLHRASSPDTGKTRDMLVYYLTSSPQPKDSDWAQYAGHQQFLGLSRAFV